MHMLDRVEYVADDAQARSYSVGALHLSGREARSSSAPTARSTMTLRRPERARLLDCIDCHNVAGHNFQSPGAIGGSCAGRRTARRVAAVHQAAGGRGPVAELHDQAAGAGCHRAEPELLLPNPLSRDLVQSPRHGGSRRSGREGHLPDRVLPRNESGLAHLPQPSRPHGIARLLPLPRRPAHCLRAASGFHPIARPATRSSIGSRIRK